MSLLLTFDSTSGLVDLALKSAAVMLLTLVAATLLGRASSARRHLVWCLGVAGLLLLPALLMALPAWRVTWLPQLASVQAREATTEQPASVQANRSNPIDIQPMTEVVLPASTVTANAGNVVPAVVIKQGRLPSASLPWLALVWMAGVLLSLIPLALGLWQLTALHRRSKVIDDQRWLAQVNELRQQLAVRRSVQLRQSDAALAPLTWGALRPVLLVPAEASTWSDQRRQLVLLHELAHIRRWDWLTQLVAHVACALYWFNPLVWLAARQMRVERERACDDLVLASGARASDYAQELLAVAARLSASRLSTLVAVPMARHGALEDRLRGILDNRRSRTALTTAAVCLGAVLAGVTIAPLAMLRAAPPAKQTQLTVEPAKPVEDRPKEEPVKDEPIVEKPTTEKPVERDAKQKEIDAARAKGISISVMNAKGDRGIPEFRVIAGVSSGSVSGEFQKRTGKTVVNWQPHTCRIGKDGGYIWPLDQAYAEMSLRVEADGYQPQVFPGLKKSGGAQQIVFLLAEDKGVAGRVVTPDGKPAAGATVALALPRQDIVWDGGKLRGEDEPLPEKPGDRWSRPRFIKTDADGVFRLPTETEPAAVLIIHDSGVLEIAYDVWEKSPEVTLRKWGGIAGQVLWQDKPGADELITLIVHRDKYGYPGMIASYANTRTDKDGKFTFDRLLPGPTQISRPFKPDDSPDSGQVILNGMFQHVKVAAGDATKVLLGGQGRQVTGKFVGLDSWDGATYHFHPEAPHIGGPRDNGMWVAFGKLKQSPIGPILFRDKQPINKDGTFTIENMLPGRYQLFLSVPGSAGYAASTQVQVELEVPGEKPAPLDLKEIAAVKRVAKATQPPADQPADKKVEKPAEKPASKPAAKPEAKTVTIRGKVLDDATGEPIERIIIQAGHFEPADPKKLTWGYSESRSSSRDGLFSTTVRWAEGWTARVLADGYIPHPVLTSAPPADKDEIEVTLRLKRGPKVRGVVLDHEGKPVKDAAVFAIGPTGVNLAGGQAWSSGGGNDADARPARTDEQGRFELPIGEAKSLAVSHAKLDAWPAEIPAKGDVTIRLPEPARVEIDMGIEGADKESVVFYQLLSHLDPAFTGVRLERDVKVANPGKLSLAGLPPGKYQFCRQVMNRLPEFGTGAMLERQFFELKAGETKSIKYVREKGSRLKGKVASPENTKFSGMIVSVQDEKAKEGPFDKHKWTTSYASHTAAADGTFLTERIAPGKYLLVARAYTPIPEEQRFRSGAILPSHRAEMKIEVSDDGEVTVPDLVLKPSKGDDPFR